MQHIERHSNRLRLFVWPKTDPREEVKPSLLESNDDESNKLEKETEERRGEEGYGRRDARGSFSSAVLDQVMSLHV